MTNRKNVWTPLLYSATLAVGMFLGFQMKNQMPGKGFFQVDKARPVQEILDLVRNRYVDSVNTTNLSDTAIQALLLQLDPHSVFIPADEVEAMDNEIQGRFFGIGIEYAMIDDTLTVLQVVKDGPSAKVGVQSGDQVVKVDGAAVAGQKLDAAAIRKKLQGDLGTQVKVNILRAGKPVEVAIQRGIIPLHSVDAAYKLNDTTGYIRLNKFSQQTYREFMIELDKLVNQKITALVLDLRGNGGGVLDEATSIADEFLDGDKLITYTEGRSYPRKEYRCKRPGLFEKGKLVVLCDEGSASASEVLIGALQDWDRATVIGRRSFGKGLVQEQYNLSDGSAVRLTIARYYTPLGRSIQRAYKPGQRSAYYGDINQRYSDGEMYSNHATVIDSSKVYTTRTGKKLYGGGGIAPDLIVPADTTGYTKASAKLTSTAFVYRFASKYYVQEQQTIRQRYPQVDSFQRTFRLQPADWSVLEQFAKRDSISSSLNNSEKNLVEQRIKAAIARQVWGDNGLFRVLNASDKLMLEVEQVLR
jgi:carboxyl-terminal processing protease